MVMHLQSAPHSPKREQFLALKKRASWKTKREQFVLFLSIHEKCTLEDLYRCITILVALGLGFVVFDRCAAEQLRYSKNRRKFERLARSRKHNPTPSAECWSLSKITAVLPGFLQFGKDLPTLFVTTASCNQMHLKSARRLEFNLSVGSFPTNNITSPWKVK